MNVRAGAVFPVLVSGLIAWLPLGQPVHDQLRLFVQPGLPFEDGMVTKALAIASGWLTADLWWRHALVSGLAGWLNLTGLWWALQDAPRSFRVLAFVTYSVSGLWLVWGSADVLAAAGVCWMIACRDRWWALALVTVLTMFTKADLLLPAFVLGFALSRHLETRVIIVGLAVALLVVGLTDPHRWSRATHSYLQHSAYVLHGDENPNAFNEWERYRNVEPPYARFVAGSVLHSAKTIAAYGLWPLFLMAGAACWCRRDRLALGSILFVALSMITITALAFVHFRYLGRFSVLALMCVGLTWPKMPPWAQRSAIASLLIWFGATLWYLPAFPIVD